MLDLMARSVLAHYPCAWAQAVDSLGNRGGFSGARLWRVQNVAGPLCLRAWPESRPGLERLRDIHERMEQARRAGLEFVPALLRTHAGATWVEASGRVWEITTWLPGRADFHERPTPRRLEAACLALARLHAVWRGGMQHMGACPAVARRLEGLRGWAELVGSGWGPNFTDPSDPVEPWARRAWGLVQAHLPNLAEVLAPWTAVSVPLQPCLCDVWHDHVLFDGDSVTGLVDYGSVKRDHVAADLARLLGSLVPDDPEMTAVGLEAYGRLRPLGPLERALVAVLDQTGTVLAAANWLMMLYHQRRAVADRDAVADRLGLLVRRIAAWQALGLPGSLRFCEFAPFPQFRSPGYER
jgi:Ser/Thr protein kinase RdoA (MazF antagonist)